MKNQVLLFFVITISLFSCSPANIIVTGKTRPAISKDKVVIYDSQTTPENYEIIGRINVQSESTLGRAGAHNRNMYKLREKAASVGANGLLIGDTQNSHNAWGDGFMSVNATAIYVDPNAINTLKKDQEKKRNNMSKAERIRELKELFDEGILTQVEYEKEKKKILDEK